MSEAAGGETPTEPPRRFGMGMATFLVVSSMVGSGVLTTSGFTVNAVGSNLLMLGLWVVGGIAAVCGALCIAELSATLPRSGGDTVFLRESYGPLLGFLSGWMSLLVGFGGPIASNAFAAAKYLLAPLAIEPESARWVQLGLATAIILVLATGHLFSHGASLRIQGAATIVKLAILTVFVVAGWVVGAARWGNLLDAPVLDGPTWSAAVFSLVYISYAYTGWNGAGFLAGEVAEPQRRLPRAIGLGTGLVLLLYLAINCVYAFAIPATEARAIAAASPDGPNALAPYAELAAARLFGRGWSSALSIAIGVTLLASLSAFILSGARVVYAMARAGHLPEAAGRLSSNGTPVIATIVQVAWSLVVLWSGSFEQILIYSSVGLAIFSMLTVGAVIVLRWRRPDLPRPFRTPGYPVTPLIFLIITGLLTERAFRESAWTSTLSLLSILAGIPVFWAFESRRRRMGSEADH